MSKYLLIFLLALSYTTHAQRADFGIMDFSSADSVAALYQGKSLNSLPILAYKLTKPLATKEEQFRSIYTWVSNNIENDYGYYLQNKKKREKLQQDNSALNEWNTDFQSKVFEKLLKEQKTVCTGYAYLIKELASLAGIDCKIINGYGRTASANIGYPAIPNHSWNAVQLNNQWYLCDATWSSGNIQIQDNHAQFVHDYAEGYFLAEPDLFAQNHYPLDTAWLLMKHPISLQTFLQAPLIYKHAFNYQILPLSPTTMEVSLKKNKDFECTFHAPNHLQTDKIQLEIHKKTQVYTVKPRITHSQDGLLTLKYNFAKTGHYDVHVKIHANEIITYTVVVQK